ITHRLRRALAARADAPGPSCGHFLGAAPDRRVTRPEIDREHPARARLLAKPPVHAVSPSGGALAEVAGEVVPFQRCAGDAARSSAGPLGRTGAVLRLLRPVAPDPGFPGLQRLRAR